MQDKNKLDPQRITWSGDIATIAAQRTLRGEVNLLPHDYDFEAYNLHKGGLFDTVFEEWKKPPQSAHSNNLKAFLEFSKHDKNCRAILNSDLKSLTKEHVVKLYQLIEDYLEGKESITAKNSVSTMILQPFRTCKAVLGDNCPIDEVGYTSRFRSVNHSSYKTKGKQSDKGILNQDKLLMTEPKEDESLESAIVKAMKHDLEKVEDACWENIEFYIKVKDAIKQAKKSKLQPKSKLKLDEETNRWTDTKLDSLYKLSSEYSFAELAGLFGTSINSIRRVVLEDTGIDKNIDFKSPVFISYFKEIEIHKCYMHENYNKLDEITVEYNLFSKSNSVRDSSTMTNPLLAALLNNGYERYDDIGKHGHVALSRVSVRQWVLCDYFIPAIAMASIEILFHLYVRSGWNSDSIIALCAEGVTKKRGSYLLESLKGKTDQEFEFEVYRTTDPKLYNLVVLLLENAKNIKKFSKIRVDSLFSVLDSHGEFRLVMDNRQLLYITVPCGISHFSRKQIRDQLANIHYLENNDPFYVREMLGHSDLNTTLDYLNQHAIRILNENNLRIFQDKLAATIVWAVKGDEGALEHNIDNDLIDEQLLFPVGTNAAQRSCISDEWIKVLGSKRFVIDNNLVDHLNWQVNYYSVYSGELKQNNPKAFLMYHIPRMLFCAALKEVINNSKYRYLLK